MTTTAEQGRERGRIGGGRRREERLAGLAYAHAWRARMKPHFDAIYGLESADG